MEKDRLKNYENKRKTVAGYKDMWARRRRRGYNRYWRSERRARKRWVGILTMVSIVVTLIVLFLTM